MALVVVKTRKQIKVDDPIVTHNSYGALTRAGALVEIRKLWGDLGTISSDETKPHLVWCIGRFGQTVGRGKTWEIALADAMKRKARIDAREQAKMLAEAAALETPILIHVVEEK